MAQQQAADSQARREVSESAFEYLLGEILLSDSPQSGEEDNSAAAEQRLELLGYSVGYRYIGHTMTSHTLYPPI